MVVAGQDVFLSESSCNNRCRNSPLPARGGSWPERGPLPLVREPDSGGSLGHLWHSRVNHSLWNDSFGMVVRCGSQLGKSWGSSVFWEERSSRWFSELRADELFPWERETIIRRLKRCSCMFNTLHMDKNMVLPSNHLSSQKPMMYHLLIDHCLCTHTRNHWRLLCLV